MMDVKVMLDEIFSKAGSVHGNTATDVSTSGGGGKPPDKSNPPQSTYDEDMEPRVKALEDFANTARERLARIEAKLDGTATKEDLGSLRTELHKAISDQTWRLITWVSGISAGLVAAVFFIARNVH